MEKCLHLATNSLFHMLHAMLSLRKMMNGKLILAFDQTKKARFGVLSHMQKADLNKPETIPTTLVGAHTLIDCATS